jgi:hypothetical protein
MTFVYDCDPVGAYVGAPVGASVGAPACVPLARPDCAPIGAPVGAPVGAPAGLPLASSLAMVAHRRLRMFVRQHKIVSQLELTHVLNKSDQHSSTSEVNKLQLDRTTVAKSEPPSLHGPSVSDQSSFEPGGKQADHNTLCGSLDD